MGRGFQVPLNYLLFCKVKTGFKTLFFFGASVSEYFRFCFCFFSNSPSPGNDSPPSGAVIVADDECEHYLQSRGVRIDFVAKRATLKSTTHESSGRLIYTARAAQCPLSSIPPARRRLRLSSRLPRRALITDPRR